MESAKVFHAMNDIVISRGESSFLAKIDIFVNTHFVCTMPGDGVIIATPTGSTAYSMASGGSIVHNDIPCICMTPICPYSLSSRPLILPEYSMITIKVNPTCRMDLQITIDGFINDIKLKKEEVLLIQASQLEVPSILYFFTFLTSIKVITGNEKKSFKSWAEKLRELLGYCQ